MWFHILPFHLFSSHASLKSFLVIKKKQYSHWHWGMISHALLRQCFQWCPLKPPLSKKLGIAEIYLHAFPSYQAMTPNNTVPLTDLDNRTGQRQNFPFARHFNIFFFFPELQEKIYIRKIPKQQILNRFHFRNTGLFPNQNESSSPPNSWKPSSC